MNNELKNFKMKCIQEKSPQFLASFFVYLKTFCMFHQNNLSLKTGVPKGIRTPVFTVKGWCPRPG